MIDFFLKTKVRRMIASKGTDLFCQLAYGTV